jgi:hypothetical protein
MASGDYAWEWIVEIVDGYGEILDSQHFDSLADLVTFVEGWRSDDEGEGVIGDFGLVATGPSEGLPFTDRSWVYLNADGTLPTHTSGGLRALKVPNRFHAEAAAAAKR